MKSFCEEIDSRCEFRERIEVRSEDGLRVEYSLVAVAVHSGSADAGHYYAYGKREMWYCFNDEHITRVAGDTVLNAQAYMLFYKRD